ncbi:MAG: glycosyltransferase family 1 protein [Deltaproteobacteria bacterium]|nr:glycosyltransferase family 1 protein [Deltaproteobacteria bacterium]
MDSLRIALFRNYVEDERISMEIYADGLVKAMRTYFPGRCSFKEFVPTLPKGSKAGLWGMRLARYVRYPWQARCQPGRLNHIVDPGYGHLLYILDPRHTVVTVHDLIPLIVWRGDIPGSLRGKRPWLNMFSFNALRRAKHLIAVSKNTHRDLVNILKIPDYRISVIYPGIDKKFRPYGQDEKTAAGASLGLTGDQTKRVLVTGATFYKNHSRALRAFARLRTIYAKPLQLLKLGTPTPEFKTAVRNYGLEDITHYLVGVSGDQMPALYNRVDILLFPSLYEGFGWPPLEAMACGTPVVASNAASLPEVIGDAGLMCPPQDYEGLAQAMYALLTDNDLRQAVIERGLLRAARFTWESVARQTLAVYESVIYQDD